MSDSNLFKVKKRDERLVDFDENRIMEAIWGAAKSVGGNDKSIANDLTQIVCKILKEKFSDADKPLVVETVQDIIEQVLIENGHSRTAKSYILYRQNRTQVREEKKKILEKEEIDSVDKGFDINALRVLKARYLRKDETGKLIETPEQLFTRIAVHTVIPDLFYDALTYDPTGSQIEHSYDDFNPKEYVGKLFIGKYSFNEYHIQAIRRLYRRFNREGKIKISFSKLIELITQNQFDHYEKAIDEFYTLLITKRFMPNTPAIANFGNALGMGSACFVMGIEDNMESIMETLKNTALVFKAGGGMGYNFSKLRPEGDFVSTTSGVASGPISFIRLFDTMTEVIKQGGIRRGANMGILNINHPDIEKFIRSKSGNKALRNFNISVLITPDFWEYYDKNEPYPLVNPRNGNIVRKVNPRMLFDLIVYQAWESAEPGVIFSDHVNDTNPLCDGLGPIITTNPCGEVLLYPNESCNLGSINVWQFVNHDDNGKITYNWDALAETVRSCCLFLDNVIDVNNYPLKQIEEMTLATRKIGLGIMGLADLLYELRLSYNSEEGREFMSKLMEFINYHSKITSIELAQNRGSFPYYKKSFYPEGKLPFSGYLEKSNWNFDWKKICEETKKGIRNAYTTVIAPTGSISMIAGCSSGVEPVYSLIYEKNVKVGSFYYVDHVFEETMKLEGIFDDKLLEEVSAHGGSIQDISYISPDLKKIFVTAHSIAPKDHIKALAIFQKWVDSSISKTNNFPADATVDDMRESYLLAYKLGCKDVTVFRDTSITEQVLVAPTSTTENKIASSNVPPQPLKQNTETQVPTDKDVTSLKSTFIADDKSNSKCPECLSVVVFKEGCLTCPSCGWGYCT